MVDTVSPHSPAAAASALVPHGSGWAAGPRVALLVFAGYYAGARLGLALTFMPLPTSVLWPPNAIVLGALLLLPVSAWWIVVLAALPAHLMSELHEGIPAGMVLSWYVSNMSEALIGASLVCALHKGPPALSTLRGMVTFIIAACVAAVASSFLDSALVKANAWGDVSYWELWRRRVFSNIAASLVIAPLVVAWGRGGWPLLHKGHRRERVEAALLVAGLLAVVAVGLSVDSAWVAPCAPLPFLLWAALRFGTRGATAAFAAIAVAAIWGAGHGIGAFVSGTRLSTTHSVQIFLMSVGSVLLCLAAASEERRRTQEALDLMRYRLNHASRLAVMGEMAASIAHEVNQPMSAILGNVEAAQALLQAGSLDERKLRPILEDIREDNLRAVDIVRHIRNLARHRPPEMREFDLAEQVRAVLSLGAPLARHRGIALDNRCDERLMVRGDPIHVQQVLANLVLNAMDAMEATPHEDRRLEVDVRPDGASARVSVRDRGHGIADSQLEQIFESFFTTKHEGTGLGLSISRSLVTAQGGRIWAQNHPGGGAIVCFTMPLAYPAGKGGA